MKYGKCFWNSMEEAERSDDDGWSLHPMLPSFVDLDDNNVARDTLTDEEEDDAPQGEASGS